MRQSSHFFVLLFSLAFFRTAIAQPLTKEELLYVNSFSVKDSLQDWVMEGPGSTECKDGWMQLYSPKEKGHHVLWFKKDIPENFRAEWEVQNLNPKAGLCIVFFAATGLNGEAIFDVALPKRNGQFKQYINGAIKTYHISYYANAKNEPGRAITHLRKNPGFQKVQAGKEGIPIHSQSIHKIVLMKQNGLIQLFVDDRSVIHWEDKTDILGKGKIGFRQMKWTRFAYRNFRVWTL
jgi:hypothetical protein